MFTLSRISRSAVPAIACLVLAFGPVAVQADTYKYSTPIPSGIASPDTIDTRLGTLKFFDGFPDKATAEKLWDNLDFQRSVQAFLLGMPAVSQAANREAFRTLGPLNTLLPIYEQLHGLTFPHPHRQRQHSVQLGVARSLQGADGA